MTLPVICTLAEAKLFLRVDHDDEDAVIQELILTATAEALHLADDIDPEGETFPPGLKTAILMHVCAIYEDRYNEGASVPDASAALARRHRNWSV